MGQITVSCLVSQRTKEPKVELSDPSTDWLAQLSVSEARALGFAIIEAVEAAVSDGFIFDFLTKHIELDASRASMVLNEFREYRGKVGAWPRRVNTHDEVDP